MNLNRITRIIKLAKSLGLYGTITRIKKRITTSLRNKIHARRYFFLANTSISEIKKYLEKSESTRPLKIHSIHLEPSLFCNLRCPGCQLTINIEKGIWSYNHMKYDDFVLVCDNLPAANVLTLHNYGEPSMNPDLHKMVSYAAGSRKFDTISSTTNLLTRNPKFFGDLFHRGLDHLTISVDSFNSEIAELLRTRTNVERLNAACANLIKLYPEKLTIAIVVSKINISDLSNTLFILNGYSAPTKIRLHVSLIRFEDPGVKWIKERELDLAQLSQLEEMVQVWEDEFPHLYITPPPNHKHIQSEICTRPWVTPKVTQDGILTVCGRHLEPAIQLEKCDLRKRRFEEIIRDPAMMDFLSRYILEAPTYCQGCESYFERINENLKN
jgi:MoaA/NifB/PqqE/SkfB family radical SAM enzyme